MIALEFIFNIFCWFFIYFSNLISYTLIKQL